MKTLFKSILTVVAVGVLFSFCLILIRFGGPRLRFCEERGRGYSTRTVCIGVVEFKGSDIKSIYRIRFLKG